MGRGRIELVDDQAAVEEAVTAMLATSRKPGAEEWAIHDYEGFGPLRVGEYDGLAWLSAVAAGTAEHGPAYLHWAVLCTPGEIDELGQFEDQYVGHFPSMDAYVEELVDESGVESLLDEHLPDWIRPYVEVDIESLAHDFGTGDVYASSSGDNGVYLFYM